MNIKDKIFIFFSAVLVILFVASVLEKTSLIQRKDVSQVENIIKDTSKALNRLKEKNLIPQEAEYYKVIDE